MFITPCVHDMFVFTCMCLHPSIGNIGKKLTDVSARDIDYHMYTGSPADDDSLSQGSGDSNEELRWRLHNLSREVDHLKATMGKLFDTLMFLFIDVFLSPLFPFDMQCG